MTTETNIENSPEYQQVKQRIKQANVNMMSSTKFYQGEHGFDDSFDVGNRERKTSYVIYALLSLLLVWAFIGAYHYFDSLTYILALGEY